MSNTPIGSVCWFSIWNNRHDRNGMEYLVLTKGAADSVIVAVDEDNSCFRLDYHLGWAQSGCLENADLTLQKGLEKRSLKLRSDGLGHWKHADGQPIPELEGCIDIDIWPTPFTNSLPLWRTPMNIGERKEFRMAWVNGCELAFEAKSQAYSRLGERHYVFESLDGSHFQADLHLDKNGLVIDYPELFERIECGVKPS